MLILKKSRRRSRAGIGAIALISTTLAMPVAAHDFWLQPRDWWPAPGAVTGLALQVGHAGDRQRSAIPLRRIARFDALTPDGRRIDLLPTLHLGASDGDASLRFDRPGLYVLAFASDDRAESRLPAARFNEYLLREGLAPALALRDRTHRSHADGIERYGRRAKALLQVGAAESGTQVDAAHPLGLTLELVPEVSPYLVPRAAQLPVRVYYQGKPLAGALVKLYALDHDGAPVATARSDTDGRVRFAMPERGGWMLSVVWTRPLPEGGEFDFETVFSSLSFGFPAHPATTW